MKKLLTLFLFLFALFAQAQVPTAADLLKGLFSENAVECDSLSTPETWLTGQSNWKIDYYSHRLKSASIYQPQMMHSIMYGRQSIKVKEGMYEREAISISYSTKKEKLWKEIVNDFIANHGFAAEDNYSEYYKSLQYPCVSLTARKIKGEYFINLYISLDDYSQFAVGYNLVLKSLYCDNKQHCLDSLIATESYSIKNYFYLHPSSLDGMTLDSVALHYNPATLSYLMATDVPPYAWHISDIYPARQNKIRSKFCSNQGFALASILPDSIVDIGYNEPDTLLVRKLYLSNYFPDVELISYRRAEQFAYADMGIYWHNVYYVELRRKTTGN